MRWTDINDIAIELGKVRLKYFLVILSSSSCDI